jgi:hypothetical protein
MTSSSHPSRKPFTAMTPDIERVIQQIAADTISLNNREAWRAFYPALKNSGWSSSAATKLCHFVWAERKRIRAQSRLSSRERL